VLRVPDEPAQNTASASQELWASAPSPLMDEFRVPYSVSDPSAVGVGWIGSATDSRQRVWWVADDDGDRAFYRLGDVTVFASVARYPRMRALADRLGPGWWADEMVEDLGGGSVSAVWRHPAGGYLLPFDPSAAIEDLQREEYTGGGRRSLAMGAYYRIRPLLPRRVQLSLRRLYSRRQARRVFPRWPAETSLHDLAEMVLGMLAAATHQPVPTLAAWPDGATWGLVLTHDVETDVGYRNLWLLSDLEEHAGYRSSWNFVPLRYAVADEVVRELRGRGHEIGVHGLYHDGRDLASPEIFAERLPAISAYRDRWHAVGFRSPATHRNWDLMSRLPFAYDSSYPDSDPFEPQSGGCCSWLPFMNGLLVELPITLVQDHTAFQILGQPDGRLWIEKARLLRERGGMALLITHPDYMLESSARESYRLFLEEFADDAAAWRALPCEVADWWRQRQASRIVLNGGSSWTVEGPAAGRATIRLVCPPGHGAVA
jgi:peptidoglycan/xylan/chitin deacetylase (PgdA/CDA1 family)